MCVLQCVWSSLSLLLFENTLFFCVDDFSKINIIITIVGLALLLARARVDLDCRGKDDDYPIYWRYLY